MKGEIYFSVKIAMSADTIMNLSKLIQDLKQRVSILEFEVAELKKNKNDTQQQPIRIEKHDPINPVIPYDNFIPFERAGHENDESYRCHRFGLYAAKFTDGQRGAKLPLLTAKTRNWLPSSTGIVSRFS